MKINRIMKLHQRFVCFGHSLDGPRRLNSSRGSMDYRNLPFFDVEIFLYGLKMKKFNGKFLSNENLSLNLSKKTKVWPDT